MDFYEVLNYKKINLIGCESWLLWFFNNKLGFGMFFFGDVLMMILLWCGFFFLFRENFMLDVFFLIDGFVSV